MGAERAEGHRALAVLRSHRVFQSYVLSLWGFLKWKSLLSPIRLSQGQSLNWKQAGDSEAEPGKEAP